MAALVDVEKMTHADAAAKWLKDVRLDDKHKDWWQMLTGKIMRLTDTANLSLQHQNTQGCA